MVLVSSLIYALFHKQYMLYAKVFIQNFKCYASKLQANILISSLYTYMGVGLTDKFVSLPT